MLHDLALSDATCLRQSCQLRSSLLLPFRQLLEVELGHLWAWALLLIAPDPTSPQNI